MEVAQLLQDHRTVGGKCSRNRYSMVVSVCYSVLVGERHLKVMVRPVGGSQLLDGIAFNIEEYDLLAG